MIKSLLRLSFALLVLWPAGFEAQTGGTTIPSASRPDVSSPVSTTVPQPP
jgi:hypothetical protein